MRDYDSKIMYYIWRDGAMEKNRALKFNEVNIYGRYDEIKPYDEFISIMREHMDDISPGKCILLMSGEVRGFKYNTDVISVEERREIVKFYKSFITMEKDIICVTKAYGDNFITARYMDFMKGEEFLSKFNMVVSKFYEKAKEAFSDISINLTLGVNIISEKGHDIAAELDNANYARLEAEKTMQSVVVFREEMIKDRLQKVKLVNEFDEALSKGEFKVYYQPKVDSLCHNVVGGEALVRWVKSDGTIIPPFSFIELFEENRYIIKLDYFVYDHVFQYIADRIKAGQYVVPISMNVSRIHMEDNGIIEYINFLLDKYKVPVQYLEFEITENVCMLQMENTLKFIDAMKSLGIKVSMDDFGSGYSSLNLLSEVPVDILKVDRKFFINWDKSPKKQIIIDSILSMAKKLHISVVCEGVEYEEQSRYLGLAGCDMLQGFYFSRPIPEADFTKYIDEHKAVKRNVYIFGFDGSLSDTTGVYEGKIRGKDVRFAEGMAKGRKVLYFPGGNPASEIIEMPKISYLERDFTLSMWIKAETTNIWTSVFYADYENIFVSVMPLAKDEKAVFRMKVKSEPNGWYDVLSTETLGSRWTNIVASYNAETSVICLYVNGIMAKSVEVRERPEVLRRVMLGGDIYQRSFNGYVGELRVYNYPLGISEIKDLYIEQSETYRE